MLLCKSKSVQSKFCRSSHGKNDFAKESKNLAKYKVENNFGSS